MMEEIANTRANFKSLACKPATEKHVGSFPSARLWARLHYRSPPQRKVTASLRHCGLLQYRFPPLGGRSALPSALRLQVRPQRNAGPCRQRALRPSNPEQRTAIRIALNWKRWEGFSLLGQS